MTYTECEICGVRQYCFLQFNKNAVNYTSVAVQRAICPQCLTAAYKQKIASIAMRGVK